MDPQADLQAEVMRLREEVEAYRRRELEELRARLATAEAEASHYRAEAQRNADLGRQIHLEAQQAITSLRAQLESRERMSSVRPAAPGRPQ